MFPRDLEQGSEWWELVVPPPATEHGPAGDQPQDRLGSGCRSVPSPPSTPGPARECGSFREITGLRSGRLGKLGSKKLVGSSELLICSCHKVVWWQPSPRNCPRTHLHGLTVPGTFWVIHLLENLLYKEEPDSTKNAPARSQELVRTKSWGASGNGILTSCLVWGHLGVALEIHH